MKCKTSMCTIDVKDNRRQFLFLQLVLFLTLSGSFILFGFHHISADEQLPALSDRQFSKECTEISEAYDSPVTEAQAERNPYVNARLILKSEDPTIDPEALGAVEAIRDREGHYVLQFESSQEARKAEALLTADAATDYVEPDIPIFIKEDLSAQNTDYSQINGDIRWGVRAIGVSEYRNARTCSGNVRIAFLDTGVNYSHPFFSTANGITVSSGYNFISNGTSAADDNGHGTIVAGIAAQCIRGLTNITIVPYKVLNYKGSGSLSCVLNGINDASSKGIEIINLSLGGENLNSAQSFLEYSKLALERGSLLVFAAGNERNNTGNCSPAFLTDNMAKGCLIVSAVENAGTIDKPNYVFASGYSNYGTSVDIAAPGTGIYSSYKNGYTISSGTSMAVPFVSAAAALIKASNPGLNVLQLENAVVRAATDLGTPGKDIYYGHGMLDLRSILSADLMKLLAEQNPSGNDSISARYVSSQPAPNVTYTVPLKKKQKTSALRVVGLSGGDHVVFWRSSNKNRVSVQGKKDGSCVIRAGKIKGKAVVTALTASGKTVTFRIRVQSSKVKTKKISIASKAVTIAAGENFLLQPSLYPITSRSGITYRSSAGSVASVSKNGVVRGLRQGKAVIRIRSGSRSIKVTVIVK